MNDPLTADPANVVLVCTKCRRGHTLRRELAERDLGPDIAVMGSTCLDLCDPYGVTVSVPPHKEPEAVDPGDLDEVVDRIKRGLALRR